MSSEPQFEQFEIARNRSLGGWLAGAPFPNERGWLWLGLVLALLATLPVVVATYPQMVDYPAHLARFHVMLERDNSPFLQRYYGFEWRWMGNLGADLLIHPLAAAFGLELAGRIIAGLIPLLTGLGMVCVEWTLRRRVGPGALLAMALIWSPALLLGFLNFGLALAMALFAFAAWVKLEGKPWRAALFLPVGLAVWLAHVSGWGVLGILVFGYEWRRVKGWAAFLAPWPLALPFVAVLAGGGDAASIASYGPAPEVYKWAIWKQAMRGSVQWLDHASVILIGAVLLGSLAWKRIDGRLGWAAAIMLLGSLVLPRHIFGGDYVDARLISTGLMVGCLALSWRAPRWLLLLAPALFLARLGLVSADWHRGSQETARIVSALDHVPQGARIANLVVTERRSWGYNTQEHVGGYAVVRKDALINSNFALPGVHMMTIREGGARFQDPYHRMLHWPGTPIDLSDFGAAQGMDWLWYVGKERPVRLPDGAAPAWQGQHSELARLANPRPRS